MRPEASYSIAEFYSQLAQTQIKIDGMTPIDFVSTKILQSSIECGEVCMKILPSLQSLLCITFSSVLEDSSELNSAFKSLKETIALPDNEILKFISERKALFQERMLKYLLLTSLL